ncbi:glycosyltransferase [Thioalkalivibrio sp. ALE11]|uniref:glycosyltransferase n=1 Tax=Thioalkalivibrio sp. ALE11 TaxID=1265494 RepID=UPI00037EB63B|nr:glycosyltransferase [Thioalkalivibrio sp. ALE11]
MSLPLRPFVSEVDVIVPVFRGLEATRACVESVLAATPGTPFRLVVVNDATPEPALADWLAQLEAREDPRVRLLHNKYNLGFVRSVNRGMTLHPDRDVVLLNSDTRVSGRWLDRLRACAWRDPDTGTATPLTNNGTLASYPVFMRDNPGVRPEAGATLDALAAEVNAGLDVPVPTAVGFCMYIRRACLEQVGYFDAAAFGRGYGEENEFCMRATDLGWEHRLCGDVFVHHQGGVSFGAEAPDLKTAATEALQARYPDYPDRVAAFVARDPGCILRRRLDLARLQDSPLPRVLFISHRQGGGVARHCEELARLLQEDQETLVLEPADRDWVVLKWLRDGEEFQLHFRLPEEYPALHELLRDLAIGRVHVHHVMEHPQGVLRLAEDLGVPLDFTIHDYYSICPQYNLTDEKGEYCGEPDETGCARCLAVRPAPWGLDIVAWRNLFVRLLNKAERVIAPSEDVHERLLRYVPDADIRVLPHFDVMPEPGPDMDALPHQRERRDTDTVRVLILGVVNPAKGVHLLERCAWDARKRGLGLHFTVIGYSETAIAGLDQLPLEITGEYRPHELPQRIADVGGDVVFLPTRAPETYSFTLSEALATGLPVVGPRRGALPERTRGLSRVRLLDPDADAASWNDELLAMGRGTLT